MYFLDTYAMLEFVKGNTSVKALLDNASFFTSDFQLMELFYITLRNDGLGAAERYFEAFSLVRKTIPEQTLKNAMKMRLEFQKNKKNISYVDAIGYQYAMDHSLVFLTGDLQFEKLENVKWIK